MFFCLKSKIPLLAGVAVNITALGLQTLLKFHLLFQLAAFIYEDFSSCDTRLGDEVLNCHKKD